MMLLENVALFCHAEYSQSLCYDAFLKCQMLFFLQAVVEMKTLLYILQFVILDQR